MSLLKKLQKPGEISVPKPKILFQGDAKVGKTTFALKFPRAVYVDSEDGASRPQYQKALEQANSMYFGKAQGAHDIRTVINLIKELATNQHDYKTLVLDSYSYLYNLECAEAETRVGTAFGAHRAEANKPTRKLLQWVKKIDMTVVIIGHPKEKWDRKTQEIIDTSFDGYDKLKFDLDLWLEIIKDSKTNKRMVRVKGSRVETMPEGKSFISDFKIFKDLYGADIIERKSEKILLATPEQVERLSYLVNKLNKPEVVVNRWLLNSEAQEYSEMRQNQIQACIDNCEKELKAKESEDKL